MAKRSLRDGCAHPAELVAAGMGVIAVTYGLARYGFGVYLPQFRADFGLGAGLAGGIAAGSYLAYCAAALLAQRWVGGDRARAALWLAGGSAAAGSVAVATAWSVPVLALGVLVAGSGAGAASPALVAAVTATVRPAAEPRAQAVVNSGTGAGVVAAGALVLTVPEHWRAAWAGFAVLALLLTWAADRRTAWSAAAPGTSAAARLPLGPLARPLVASLVTGVGCASVWTFGRDLLAGVDGGLSDRVTGLLWCLLGAAGLAGALSGDVVRRYGLRRAWTVASVVSAAAVALLAGAPDAPGWAAVALLAFGCAYVALTGVLIAWGAHRTPGAPAQAAAVLFVGLTVGQAAGALLLGGIADALGMPRAFLVAAGLVLAAAVAAEPRSAGRTRPAGVGPAGVTPAGIRPAGTPASRHR